MLLLTLLAMPLLPMYYRCRPPPSLLLLPPLLCCCCCCCCCCCRRCCAAAAAAAAAAVLLLLLLLPLLCCCCCCCCRCCCCCCAAPRWDVTLCYVCRRQRCCGAGLKLGGGCVCCGLLCPLQGWAADDLPHPCCRQTRRLPGCQHSHPVTSQGAAAPALQLLPRCHREVRLRCWLAATFLLPCV